MRADDCCDRRWQSLTVHWKAILTTKAHCVIIPTVRFFCRAVFDSRSDLQFFAVLALIGEYDRADFYYRRALEVDPQDTTTLFAYAVFLESIDR